MKSLSLTLAACAVLALTGCPATSSAPAPAVSPSPTPSPTATPHNTIAAETEGCEHLAGGPAAPVTAAALGQAGPEIKADHKRYDVTLIAGTGGNQGTVRFNNAEETEWSFFLNKDVPFVVRDGSGMSLPMLEHATSSTYCTDVKAHNVFLLGVGPATIEFGPTTESSVSVVVEETHPEAHSD